VLSELDTKRQEKLLESINKGNQIFITAANLGGIPETALKNANIIKIERKGE
jgi:recombinational DNA repair ATPase RecF